MNCLASSLRMPVRGSALSSTSGPLSPLGAPSQAATSNAGPASTAAALAAPLSEEDVLRERDLLEQRSTCWACEGWSRVELEWKVLPGEPEPVAVWAFTSLDGFRAAMRLRRATDGEPRFAGARMVPGGCRLLVIFQVDGDLRLAPGAEVEVLDSPVGVRLRACTELPEPRPTEGCAGCQVGCERRATFSEAGVIDCPFRATPHVNGVMHGKRNVFLDGPDGIPVQMLRVTETEYRLQVQRPRSAAFFAGFKRESTAILQECLDIDWSRAKVGRIADAQEWPAVQDVLQQNYRKIVAIYRYMSAMGLSCETGFGVNQMFAADLIARAGLVDGKVTRISDIDRLFIAAKVMNVEMKRGLAVRNDKALVRHQFLEFLLRIAQQRFVQTKKTPSIAEGLQRVLDGLSDVSKTRIAELDAFFEMFHTESVDDVYKRHLNLVQTVYKHFSGLNVVGGGTNFMSCKEFQELLELIDAHNGEFPRQKAGFAFRLGMMTQAEETYSSRFQEMSIVEFQHALGAVVFLRANCQPCNIAELIDEFFTANLSRAVHAIPTLAVSG